MYYFNRGFFCMLKQDYRRIKPFYFSIKYAVCNQIVFLCILIKFLHLGTAIENHGNCLFTIFSSHNNCLFLIPCAYLNQFTIYNACMCFSNLQELFIPFKHLFVLVFFIPVHTSPAIRIVCSWHCKLIPIIYHRHSWQ